jgi:hypothetical protein
MTLLCRTGRQVVSRAAPTTGGRRTIQGKLDSIVQAGPYQLREPTPSPSRAPHSSQDRIRRKTATQQELSCFARCLPDQVTDSSCGKLFHFEHLAFLP